MDADPVERRCARLLRERLGTELAAHEAGEGLRALSNLFSPVHSIRQVFLLMPTASAEDWAVVARRMTRVPEAYRGFRASLEEGARRGLLVAPRRVSTVVEQLGEWAEYRRILAEQRAEAERVLPGGTPMEAMRWLDVHGRRSTASRPSAGGCRR